MGRFNVSMSKRSVHRNACDGTGGLLQQGRCGRAREQRDLLVADGLVETRQQRVKNRQSALGPLLIPASGKVIDPMIGGAQ